MAYCLCIKLSCHYHNTDTGYAATLLLRVEAYCRLCFGVASAAKALSYPLQRKVNVLALKKSLF
jgi:hypothetical protein